MKMKRIFIMTILLILFLGIGYSYLSTTLNIGGQTKLLKHNPTIIHKDINYNERIDVGDILVIDTERFYVISNDGTYVKALAEWNLEVGSKYDSESYSYIDIENPSGIQNIKAKGVIIGTDDRYGIIPRQNIEQYNQNYKEYLEQFAKISKVEQINNEELVNLGCATHDCIGVFPWLYQTTYYITDKSNSYLIMVNNGYYGGGQTYQATGGNAGVRPVITVKAKNIIQDDSIKIEKMIYKAKTNIMTEEDIGETTCVHLNGYSTTNSNGCNGDFLIRISNVTSPSDFCNNPNNTQTACGVVLEFVDIITPHAYNPAGTYKGVSYANGWTLGGYPSSSIYQFLTNNIFNSLPDVLKNNAIQTKVLSGYAKDDNKGTGVNGNYISNDKIYLLDSIEVFSNNNTSFSNNAIKDYDRQLDFYEKHNVNVGRGNFDIAMKKYNGEYKNWWCRSGHLASNIKTWDIYGATNFGENAYANTLHGVSPALRIA